jgi:formylglycine-generating enzyme required for sulfatase activity
MFGKQTLSPIILEQLKKQGKEIEEILLDIPAKVRLMSMSPSLKERVEGGEKIDEILTGQPLELSLFLTKDNKLYILRDKQNISTLQNQSGLKILREGKNENILVPLNVYDRIIFAPEEVLEWSKRGEMPPIGAMVKIPGGEFIAGAALPAADRPENEKPAHRVRISPFLVSIYPTTNTEFAEFIKANGYNTDKYWNKDGLVWRKQSKITQPSEWGEEGFDHPYQPVVGVSWYEADAYLNWAKQRFLTEHEWEYAARGGLEEMFYPWGNESPEGFADFNKASDEGPARVNDPRFAPNKFGVFHMAGNVNEFVSDFYSDTYFQRLAIMGIAENPRGPKSGDARVVRSGSWFGTEDNIVITSRDGIEPTYQHWENGFRAAMSLDEEEYK